MELMKTLFPRNFKELLFDSVKNKKNLFFITTLVMVITVYILPRLVSSNISSEFIIIGVIEIFIVIFFNVIVDFNYLHNPKKLSYYSSKPITTIQRINITIITNIIFTAALLIVLIIISGLINFDFIFIEEIYIVVIPWLIIGIFTAALSCVLTGNSIVGGISTIFNFVLPLSFLAIIYFLFVIIEGFALGFSHEILFNSFVENYYRIDYLYFIRYARLELLNVSYFIIFTIVILFIYSLTYRLLKRRKNERAGDLIVYDGYKYFITVIAASLIPIGFSTITGSFDNPINRIILFYLLFAISFYLLVALFEKSFKISRASFKVFGIFAIVFLTFIGGTKLVTNNYESYIPDIDEIESVFLNNSSYVTSKYSNAGRSIYDMDDEFVEKSVDIPLYYDKNNIESIMELHEELIENRDYYSYSNVIISYNLKNGKTVTRQYELRYDENYNGKKDNILMGLVNSSEYKERNLAFVYNDLYANKFKISEITINIDGEIRERYEISGDNINKNELREVLRKDYDLFLKENKSNLLMALRRENYMATYEKEIYIEKSTTNTTEKTMYNINIDSYNNMYDYFSMDESFINTVEYIEKITEGLQNNY